MCEGRRALGSAIADTVGWIGHVNGIDIPDLLPFSIVLAF
jgi:hypothetical protein